MSLMGMGRDQYLEYAKYRKEHLMNITSDTIGNIEYEGQNYEIDWPFQFDDPTKRDEMLAVVYHAGEQIGELCPPGFGVFETEDDVMEAAHDALPEIVSEWKNS